MKMKTLLTLPLSVFLFSAAHADTLKVEMLNKRSDGKRMVYSEDISRVNVGDTVTWVLHQRAITSTLSLVQMVLNYQRKVN